MLAPGSVVPGPTTMVGAVMPPAPTVGLLVPPSWSLVRMATVPPAVEPTPPVSFTASMMAALPVGSNALIFSQRYETLEAEATAAIVFSTLGFVMTASVWLAVLAWLG
mgnify:CR=1 FL=1